MYETNGSFGQVRLAVLMEPLQNPALFTLYNIGWHCCNDLYRFHRPQGSDKHLLLFTVRGEGFLRMRGREHKLNAGSIALLPRGEAHCYGTPDGGLWEFYWIHPDGNMCDKILKGTESRGVYINKTGKVNLYAEIINDIHALCDKRGIKFDAEISMKISDFLHLAVIDLMNFEEELSLSEKAMQYFTEHKCENVTVESCAKELYVSPSHLIRTFKTETGQTPHKFLMDEKLKEAETLIKLGVLSLKEVATLTSFSSSAHLITAYKKKYGKTPKCNR